MLGIFFLILLGLSFGVFFFRKKSGYLYSLLLVMGMVALTTHGAVQALNGNSQSFVHGFNNIFRSATDILVLDGLSAFFILVINITLLVGLLYANGYLKPYHSRMGNLRFAVHYFSYIWLYFSMLLVVMLRNGVLFLIAWEMMAISSFFLVIFDADNRNILKTGINYLVQMHVGMLFILVGFLLVEKSTGSISFDSLPTYFANSSNWPLFLLFFIGFAIKAGFMPLHTWLPEAHPAAPSHVSGVMSGVMIKMGIYGIFRVVLATQSDLLIIGVLLLAVSLISGLLGVIYAILQHDLKRLLAYHSIENIGIIGIGLGLGIIGKATNNQMLMLLGFSGALLHTLNHSLFKSLLFFNAGSVYLAAKTRDIEKCGGLMKTMPYTALLFVLGSIAICGLPPFNGFISEYLIYFGMIDTMHGAGFSQSILLLFSIIGLTLIGGLAVFCFTKAFGVIFLGSPRSKQAENAIEVTHSMIAPQIISAILIVAIGVVPALFVKPIFGIFSHDLKIIIPEYHSFIANLSGISAASGVFIIMAVGILLLRYIHLRRKPIAAGPTWGCGYTLESSRLQYTASSYADSLSQLAKPVIRRKIITEPISENDIFPPSRAFSTHSEDVFREQLTNKPVNKFLDWMKKIAIMQTGQIQHYILYAFLFMLLILILTYLNFI